MALDTMANDVGGSVVLQKNWRIDLESSTPFTAPQRVALSTQAGLDAALLASGNPAYSTQAKLDALSINDKRYAYRELNNLA